MINNNILEQDYRILLVEDMPSDAMIAEREIKSVLKSCTFKRVDTRDEFLKSIEEYKPDLIVSDYSMPAFDGLTALKLALQHCPLIPFIIFTGSMNEDTAVECMKAGATDYVIKEFRKRLGQAVISALENRIVKIEKSKTENALEQERLLLKILIDNLPSGVFVKDNNYRKIVANTLHRASIAGQLKKYGLDTQIEIIGKSDFEIYPIPIAEKYLVDDIDVIQKGISIINKEDEGIDPDGNPIWLLISKIPLRNDEGEIYGLVGITTDITERKKAEQKLQQQNEAIEKQNEEYAKLNKELIIARDKAEESDKLKSAFLNNISHEIRTPMNAIIGFSEFLKRPNLDEEKQHYFIEIITQSSNQLLSIITDIVTLATLEANQELPKLNNFNFNFTLKDLYLQNLKSAELQNNTLSYNLPIPEEKAVIITDETKFSQIINNLINNALKFTKNGSVEFGYTLITDEIIFYVKDNGIGIPENMFDEIFKSFRQVETTTARQYGGSGLGLSIAKAYVELIGGKIWLNSEIGKGSIFYFSLPYKYESISDTIPDISNSTNIDGLESLKTVLIAEDEYLNFFYLKEIFDELRINVERAVNGEEALEKAISLPIDIVIMDLKMPIMNGFEASRKIKEKKPTMHIIALSAYTNKEDIEEAFKAGCDEFLAKPVKSNKLLEIIKKILKNEN